MRAAHVNGFVLWFTGLSGAGKTTIANNVEPELERRGFVVDHLDGDIIRTHLSKGLGFSKEDRETNLRRIAFVAGEVVRHRGIAICAVVSPYEATREECRAMVGADRFVLVYVDTPLEVCEQRDPKGMYARARRGDLRGFTGIDDPYEPPRTPDLVVTTADRGGEDNARTILGYLDRTRLLGQEGVG